MPYIHKVISCEKDEKNSPSNKNTIFMSEMAVKE
jgi:hypothetical protein